MASVILQYWKPAAVVAAAFGAAKFLCWAIFARKKFSVQNKVVVITGASSGLGKALASRLHAKGARLILTARSLDKLAQICEDLKSGGKAGCHDPTFRYLDLADPNGLGNAMKELAELYGKIDIVINNAGVSMRGSCAETGLKVHRQLMEVNYFGQIQITQAAMPYLIESSGQIVVICSVQGRISIPNRSAYSASKHALQAYFDCLRAEVASDNVHVLVVSPSYMRTNLSLHAVTGSGESYRKMDETTRGGMGPEEAAEIIVRALEIGKKELVLATLKPRLAIGIRYLLPALYFWLMERRAKQKLKNE